MSLQTLQEDQRQTPPAAPKRFRRTAARNNYLNTLAECYCATVKDLGHFLYGATDESALRNVRKSLQNLRALGLVKFMTYEPEDPEEYQSGSIPRVYGLSGKGVSYARKHFPELGAEELSQSR